MDKFMSIGSRCYSTEYLKKAGLRISGPFDWLSNTAGLDSIINHLSDNTYLNILRGNYSRFVDYTNDHVGTSLNFNKGMVYPHENLYDDSTLLKVVNRFNRFKILLKTGVNLLWMDYNKVDSDAMERVDLYLHNHPELKIDNLIIIEDSQENLEHDEIVRFGKITKISTPLKYSYFYYGLSDEEIQSLTQSLISTLNGILKP